jgi:type VI secretion system protein VasJ
MAEQQVKLGQTSIPENVLELLDPISSDSPAGRNVETEENYFKLDMEIGKANPDYVVCAQLASQILKEKGKDIRVASWLCFAWFRLEKIAGLQNGLLLLTGLLKNFGSALFPSNPLHRAKALQFLNSSRFVKLIELEKITWENAPSLLEAVRSFEAFVSEAANQLAENPPEFKGTTKALASLKETAQLDLAKGPLQEKTPLRSEPEAKQASPVAPKKPPEETRPALVEEEAKKAAPPAVLSARELTLTSEKEALVAVKKALRYLIQEEKDETKRYEPYCYGLSRALVWGRTVLPAHENSITQVGSPDLSIQNKFQEWSANKEWDKLIQAIESNFLDEESGFKFWLKGQMYLCLAFENKGGRALAAAEEVKSQLSRLLGRFPDLARLKFNNQTPFADEETARWIETEILSRSQKTEQAALLPPIFGEDYEPLRQEYQAACSKLPQDFEKNLRAFQQSMAGETRRKGRFLRLLNMANFCLAAKQLALAKIYLDRLAEQIEAYQLVEWEPALCLAVWESTFVVNRRLLQAKPESEQRILLEKQQQTLFTKIGNHDGALALKLASLIPKKGE